MPEDQPAGPGRTGGRTRITLVAALGTNAVIGRDGGLPWPPTGDLTEFKRLTMGHVLVMGRRTYESIGHPLPGRTTVVVTRQQDWPAPAGVVVRHDVPAALEAAGGSGDEVFVVGGEQVYAASLPHADRLVLTRVDQAPPGDAYFPPVEWSQWAEVARDEHTGYAVVTYDRTS